MSLDILLILLISICLNPYVKFLISVFVFSCILVYFFFFNFIEHVNYSHFKALSAKSSHQISKKSPLPLEFGLYDLFLGMLSKFLLILDTM